MRRFTLLIAAFTFVVFSLNAQVVESKRLMSYGQNSALTVELYHTDKQDVEKSWIKYIRDYGTRTKKNAAREIVTDDANIAAMSRNTIDIFATMSQKGEHTELVVWFDLGGAFLSSEMHPDRFPIAETMLRDFAMSVSSTAVQEELEDQESKLQKLSDRLIRLRQEKQSLEKDILEYAQKIASAREKMDALSAEYETTKEQRIAQEASVEAVKERLKGFKGVAKK